MPVTLEIPVSLQSPPHKRWTREECAALESAGLIDPQRYELIEGELVQKMAKNPPHMRAILLLSRWLRSIFSELFVVQEPSIDVRPEDNPSSEPEPGAIVLNRSFLEISARVRPGDLRLVAEVSDTTLLFDLTTKARLYARAGIPEYWVVDVNGRRLVIHREPADGVYRSVVAYGEEERVATLAAPTVEVLVKDLL
jgi:Uma2 family endonuclease